MLISCEKPITKEQYDRARENHGYITEEDMQIVFNDAERYGYGIYSPVAREHIDEETKEITYVVQYTTSTCCD